MPQVTHSLFALLAGLTALWLFSLYKNDVSIVDRFWGLCFVALHTFNIATTGWGNSRAQLAWILVTLWGTRLSWHIHRRNQGKPEDYRYQKMRDRWGPSFRFTSLFIIFWFQGILAWVIGLPLWLTTREAGLWSLWDGVGVLLWLIGFLCEAVGDFQLQKFKSNPANRGRVMDSGLWAYTRHPNYFGDACLWFGFFFLGVGADPIRGWLFAFAPVLMTFFLVRVSGVALLEQSMAQRPGYAEYQKRTSGFIPWPPKR